MTAVGAFATATARGLRLLPCGAVIGPRAALSLVARDVPAGESWAFREHRSCRDAPRSARADQHASVARELHAHVGRCGDCRPWLQRHRPSLLAVILSWRAA